MQVLVLAGGFATRLWPLTEHRAKPLLLLDGKTILAHILQQIPPQYPTFLLTNKAFEKDFQAELKRLKRKNVTIFCEDSHCDGEKLGALKALSVAIKTFRIEENVAIMAGDNLLPKLQFEQLFCSEEEAKIAVREVETLHEAKRFGVVELEGDQVKTFEEKPENPRSRLVSTGFASLGKKLFPILHRFAEHSPDSLGSIFAQLLAEKKTVRAETIPGAWFDVGSFQTYLQAHQELQRQNIKKGKNAFEENNRFSGKVFLGSGSRVKNCTITNAIIYPQVELENCQLSHVVIDEACRLEGLDLNHKLVRRKTSLRSTSVEF